MNRVKLVMEEKKTHPIRTVENMVCGIRSFVGNVVIDGIVGLHVCAQ